MRWLYKWVYYKKKASKIFVAVLVKVSTVVIKYHDQK